MKKLQLLVILLMAFVFNAKATGDEDTSAVNVDELMETLKLYDSVTKMPYKTGAVKIGDNLATINIPAGFKFYDGEQTGFIMGKVFNNPPATYLGMLMREDADILNDSSWLFTISYDAIGYVKDKDADDINYDELLENMKKESAEDNESRKQLGYVQMEMIGWGSKPFYDKEKKALHWAMEYKVPDSEDNTLNYNIRVLGRKGVLTFNAISYMHQLEDVKKNIDIVIGSAQFEEGNKYADFNPDVDEVAAWTIGGLVAGKILAKAGLFAVLGKFAKFIFIGIAALVAIAVKFFKGKKAEPATPGDTQA